MRKQLLTAAALAAPIAAAHPAYAASGDPVVVSDSLTIDPIIDGRLRYETVDQDNAARNADALTMRLRAGAEFKMNNLSLLVEAEGTLAMIDDYNDTNVGNGVEPYSVVADPDNVELNRLQLMYKQGASAVTLGRQRIILDNARFVGNVGWRQNEQTFDAIRGQTKVGPVSLDATYSIAQHTIFGVDAGPRQNFQGDFIFAGAGVDAGPIKLKGFAYLLDFDDALANSTQTYGARATASFPLGTGFKLDLAASYAKQKDYKNSPLDYSADYIHGEAGVSFSGFGLKAGYELLGSDNGAGFRTPMATLHAFNGWADVFLNTPPAGIEDIYFGASYNFKGLDLLPGLNAQVVYHEFDSDVGSISYGSEWDASLGFKLGPVGILAKYANYDASGFSVDTEKFWLQAEFKF
ncbi:MAG: alginate export family protein [Novosphingobium sp.]|nr:alginate export family protein [Novosphingobium sp.]MCP5403936.1 alginate export family protein [Novosphingobium sp.]